MFYSKMTGGFYDAVIHGDAIPADAVEITAEDHAGLLTRQSTGQQIVTDEHGYPIAIDPPTPVRTYASLLAEVAAKRWAVETSGILIGGTPIATDRESRSQLTSVYSDLQNSLIADTPWKEADGSFTLVTLAEIEPAAQAVAAHVRACFAAEQAHTIAIEALHTQAELDSYDIHTGWPSGR